MDGQDLTTLGGTSFEDTFEDLLLFRQGLGILRTGINTHFAHIGGLMEKLLPQSDLSTMCSDKLRMEAQPDADILGLGRDGLALRPRSRRGRDGKRVNGKPLALRDESLEIRIEVKVAVKVYKTCQVSASEDMVSIPFRNVATSSIPLE